MNSQWFRNEKVFVFPMILIDFQKMHDFKIKRFLIPVRKVYEIPMFLKQEMSLGVMVLHDFQKVHESKKLLFWKSTKSAILELLGKSRKYLYSQCFCEFQKPGI